MKYIVIEIQKTGDTVGNFVFAYDTRNEAEAKYHAILAVAAVSAVNAHSAVMIDEEGNFYKSECFKH